MGRQAVYRVTANCDAKPADLSAVGLGGQGRRRDEQALSPRSHLPFEPCSAVRMVGVSSIESNRGLPVLNSLMRTLAIIQARLGSTRLPRKLLRRLGPHTLLETVVRRVQAATRVSDVVVATGDHSEDETLRDLVPTEVPVVAGPTDDVLGRFLRVLEQYPADLVVRVCADNPYIEPSLIDPLIEQAVRNPSADYVSYRSSTGKPVILTGLGMFGECVRASALRHAAEQTTDPCDREHVTRFLYRHPQWFSLCYLPVPSLLDREDLRLTVDFPEDWEHVCTVYKALGPEPLEWHKIADYVSQNEPLRHRMGQLNALCPKQ